MKTRESTPQFVHLIMVGTSLLTNNGWKPGQRLPARKELVEKLRGGNPRQLAAELNAIAPFIDRSECTRVHLLATDTRECHFCRDILKSWFQSRRIHISEATATNLLPSSPASGTDQQQGFNRGIRGFRELVFRAVRQAQKRGEHVLLNATGGLKAEVAVAVLIAAELGIDAYYVHQSGDTPLYLPTGPLDPKLRQWLQCHADSKIIRDLDQNTDLYPRLENEGLVKIGRRADGTIAQIRLTTYGKYWAGR